MGLRLFKRREPVPERPEPSIGHREAWFTIGPRGDRVTVGDLGTGL
jgi:hypothetical protein